jgi:sugar (pentulose or hexulose) kinase
LVFVRRKKVEFTNASTSQFLHPVKRDWPLPLLKKLGSPTHFLPKIVPPGSALGTFRKSLAERTGLAVNLNDPRFLNPPDMPKAIQGFCRETKQPVPKTDGELVRCCFESLALKYRETLGSLEELTGEKIEVIHIVGGGSQNQLLSQFAADACQRPVITGPVEATAMGNLLTQIRADGELGSLAEMRDVVRGSSVVQRFEPAAWAGAADRFASLRRKR